MSTPLDLPLGIHYAVPDRVYHQPQLGVARKSALKHVMRSPAHYRAWLETPPSPTPALAFGRRFDCAVFEPELFARQYVVEPDFGSCRKNDADGTTKEQGKANKDRKAAWHAEHADCEFIEADDMEAIRGMTAALRAHPLASKLLTGGRQQVTVTWQDADTGVYCQSRLDYYKRDARIVVDLKSAEDASDEGFAKACAKYDYPMQHAMYREGLAAAGEPAEHFVLVAVEKTPPYAVGVHTFSPQDIQTGYQHFRQGIEALAQALRDGAWGAYPATINELTLPRWYV